MKNKDRYRDYTNEYEEVTIKPRYALRVRDLEEQHFIRCTCFRCSHRGYVPAQTFKDRYPEYRSLKDVEHRFKCNECGFSEHNTWTTVQLRDKKNAAS